MKPTLEKIRSVATRLREATEKGVAIPPVRDEIADGGIAAAYAVQQVNTKHYLKQGRRLVGRKIGLTSKSVQKSSASIRRISGCSLPTWHSTTARK